MAQSSVSGRKAECFYRQSEETFADLWQPAGCGRTSSSSSSCPCLVEAEPSLPLLGLDSLSALVLRLEGSSVPQQDWMSRRRSMSSQCRSPKDARRSCWRTHLIKMPAAVLIVVLCLLSPSYTWVAPRGSCSPSASRSWLPLFETSGTWRRQRHPSPVARRAGGDDGGRRMMDLGSVTIEDLLPALPLQSRQALEERGILQPSPIQALAFPHISAGKHAVVHSETGSGKTLAYLLPSLERVRLVDEASPESTMPASVLILAPTRELAVQIVAEAEDYCHGEIALVALAARASWETLWEASLIVATPMELLELFDKEQVNPEEDAEDVKALVGRVEVCILDEFDELLPKQKYKGNKLARYQDEGMWPTEGLLKRLIRNNERETLQVVAASATAYSNSRKRLLKVLNRDKMERFPKMNLPLLEPNMRGAAAMEAAAAAFAVEAAAEDEEDVGDDFEEEDVAEGRRRSPRYPALPAGIKHFNWKVPVAGTHAAALAAALDKIQPESAMVFICPNAGETVKGVVEDLQQSGWSGAAALTQMLFPDSRNTGKGKSARRSGESRGWRSANRLQSLRDTTRLGFSGAADTYREAPILVSSEESVRGLHLDAVEAIFVLGMPKSAAAYLHMAGRTGRLPHPYGSAVLVAHGREIAKVTNGFSGQTGIREWTVLGRGSPPPSVLPVEFRGGQQRLPDPGRRVERPEPWETGPWRRQQMLDEVGGGADPARSSDSGRTRSAAAERLDASLGAPVRRPR